MTHSSSNELTDQLLDEQSRCWARGELILVEALIARQPEVTGDLKAVLTLIYQEVVLRQRRGESPGLDEYLHRFPHLGDALRAQFEGHLLAAALRAPTASGPTVASPIPAGPTVAEVLEQLRQSALLEPAQVDELSRVVRTKALTQQQLGRELLQRDWLTPYQVNQLLQGRARNLLLGPYLLLQRLGHGGMGEVFKARHRRLGRVVALKVIRKERLADADAVRRFQREVRAAASLSHPQIVHAFDADCVGDRYFLVMEFVDGTDLSRLIDERGPLNIAEACEYVRQAALGLQHAFETGLVHRDIKPSNLLLSKSGEPSGTAEKIDPARLAGPTVKILDLGLARLLSGSGEQSSETLTDTGVVMGTPDYIAPEQIRDCHGADIRADLYSLGCTFYHLLSGRPPFAGGSIGHKLLRQQTEEPEPLGLVREEVPPEVIAVVCKLMAKQPEDRFQTPGELAAVLTKLLRNRRVLNPDALANLDGDTAVLHPARSRRPARRWPLLVAGGTVLVAVAVVLVLVFGRGGRRTSTKPEPPEVGPLERLRYEDIAEENRLPWQPKELVQVLADHRGRHWAGVLSAAFSPDGEVVASASDDGKVRLWNPRTLREIAVLRHKQTVYALAFSADGTTLWTSADVVIEWDVATRNERRRFPNVYADCFTADGRYALWARDAATRLNDVRSGAILKETKGLPYGRLGTAFSPDSRLAVWAGGDNSLVLLDVQTGAEKRRFRGHTGIVLAAAFSPDGKSLVSGGLDGKVCLWNVATAEKRAEWIYGQTVDAVVFAHHGQHVLAAGMGAPIMWNVNGGAEGRPFAMDAPGGTVVACMAFSPDDTRILAGDNFGRVRLWDTKSRQELGPLGGPPAAMLKVSLSADGRRCVGGGVHFLRLWDVPSGAEIHTFPTKGAYVSAVGLSPNGRHLWSNDQYSQLRLWDAETGDELPVPGARTITGNSFAFSQDSTRVLVGGGRLENRDGQQIAVDCCLRLLDAGSGAESQPPLLGHRSPISSVVLSPEGNRALSGGNAGIDSKDCTVRLWDLQQQKQLAVFEGHTSTVTGVAFLSDGRRAVSGSYDQTVRLWDLDNAGKQPLVLLREGGHVQALATAPRQKWIAAGLDTGRVVFWDEAGKQIGEWQLPGSINGLSFTEDGKYIATANNNGTVYVLRTPPRR
jgi:WD40 repeat protein/serine/threonine protein kinase